ncbi:MAG: DUF1922 domain-containing protein [Methanomicrobiaceae archaeon]|jgi:hypothetical protein|nr:DUF1922 domain-containing protein [Methanomicrobiaceae archaeon]
MYMVIRCTGCRTFTYVDRFQRWKLCPVCGAVIDVTRAPAYLDVPSHNEAETLVQKLEKFLDETGKSDLNRDEKERLKTEYARWVRSQV